jgi:hypothetical protein
MTGLNNTFYNVIKKMSKSHYKLVVCVFACNTIEKYRNEILKIEETWGKTAKKMGIKIVFFLGGANNNLVEGENYVYLQGVGDDYNSASYKQNLGLKYVYENYDADFVYVCGTDTYINFYQLIPYIDTLDLSENSALYVGGHGDWRMVAGKNTYFHSGGPGFFISRAALKMIYPKLQSMASDWFKLCDENGCANLKPACDLAFAYYLYAIGNIKIIISDKFYNCNYKGQCYNNTYKCCLIRFPVKYIYACHNMSLTDFEEYSAILEASYSLA